MFVPADTLHHRYALRQLCGNAIAIVTMVKWSQMDAYENADCAIKINPICISLMQYLAGTVRSRVICNKGMHARGGGAIFVVMYVSTNKYSNTYCFAV